MLARWANARRLSAPSVHEFPSVQLFFHSWDAGHQQFSLGYRQLSTNAEDSFTPSHLRQLVQQKDYETAQKVRIDLISRDIPIPQHPVYFGVVRHIMHSTDPGKNASAFKAWLGLCPEAIYPYQNPFREEFSLIAHDPTLLHTFGLVCASKGYSWLVDNRVMPSYRDLVNHSVVDHTDYDAFKLSCEQRLQTFTHKKGPSPPSPYENDAEISLPTKIKQTLPVLLPEPQDGDEHIFEDETSSEYSDVALNIPLPKAGFILDHLESAIVQGSYIEARRILTDLMQVNVDITPAPFYGIAAQYVVGRPLPDSREILDLGPEQSVEDFSMWFSFIPQYNSPARIDLATTVKYILKNSETNLEILMNFALICASKGYVHVVSKHVIGPIMRFCDLPRSLPFLRQYEENARQYYSIQKSPLSDVKKMLTIIRGVAIRNLAATGRFDAAINLIPREKDGFLVTHTTYDVLISRLRMTQQYDKADIVEKLREKVALKQDAGYVESLRKTAFFKELESLTPKADLNQPMSKRFKWMVRSLRNGPLPTSLQMMRFFEGYIATGRTSGISLLRSVAFRRGNMAASVFVGGQMLWDYHHDFHHGVLRRFTDTFYLVGVPREEVLHLIKTSDRYKADSPNVEDPISGDKKWATKDGIDVRLFPQPIHCVLVWHSLVALTHTNDVLERLYQKLICLAGGILERQLPHILQSYSAVSSLVPSRHSVNLVLAASFTPFIGRLMSADGEARGPEILRDMIRGEIKPDIHQYTELALWYASNDLKEKAFVLLETLEGAAEKKDSRLPEPTLVTYVGLMRSFLMRREWDALLDIEERLHTRFKITPGEIPQLDELYEDWDAVLDPKGVGFSQTAKYAIRGRPRKFRYRKQ